MEIFKKHHQWPDVKKICEELKAHGFKAWLAGGCVRDGLLGISPNDFDIASDAKPGDVERIFKKTVAVGKAFGVIKVVTASGDIEVTRFRRDGKYSDGRHPDQVEPGTPEEDAQRRDFTVNALFFDLFNNAIHDFVGGQRDLKAKIIKTVGNPDQRFNEDHLRLLRAVRFVAQLDFEIQEMTLNSIKQLSHLVKDLSGERINEELSKLFATQKVYRGAFLLKETGLLRALFEDIREDLFDSNKFKKLADDENDRSPLAWLTLFSSLPLSHHKKYFEKLKMSRRDQNQIAHALRSFYQLTQFNDLSIADKKKLACLPDIFLSLKLRSLYGYDDKEAGVFIFQNRNIPDPLLTGDDLLNLGIKPGKQFGDILREALDAQLEGSLKSKIEAVKWARSKIKK